MRGQERCKVRICMEISAVVEHVNLCTSTIPAETENKWRLACSGDKVEQICTLCHPENFSITQTCPWKQLYGKFGFNKTMPVWKKWHPPPWSCGRCTSRLTLFFPSWARGSPSACSPGLGSAVHVLCLSPSEAMGSPRICRMRCNTLLLTGWKILQVFVVLCIHRVFKTEAETFVYCSTVSYTGVLFPPL